MYVCRYTHAHTHPPHTHTYTHHPPTAGSRSQFVASEVVSIASSAASMALEDARAEVIRLRTQLLLNQQQQQQFRTATMNETLHNGVLQKTQPIADEIMTMDVCTLWWLDQWVEERKSRLPKEDQGLESYKRWVWKNNKKAEAGMTNVRTTPTRTRNTGGAAAGSK